MTSRRCLATLSNIDFWLNIKKNSIFIGLDKKCLNRIGEIEQINFDYNLKKKYIGQNVIVGNISTYNTTYDFNLHLPIQGFITNFNMNETKYNHKTWLIEMLDDDFYLQSEYYKYEYGL